VIAKPALIAFWTAHPPARAPLEAWYRIMRQGRFLNLDDLKKTFARADYVQGFTVFDIGGNKYRLIAVIHYQRQKAYIRAVLTHREYDAEAWKRETT